MTLRKYAGRAAPLAAALLALASIACAAPEPASSNETRFDGIVTSSLVADACGGRLVTQGRTHVEGETRGYRFEHQFPARRSDQHYVIDVTVAAAGRLVDSHAYHQRIEEFRKRYGDRGPEYLRSQFPDIGRRAQREVLGAGPGGASSGVAFTTTDGRFDVRVTVSILLPEDVKGPDCAVESLARSISTRYDGSLP